MERHDARPADRPAGSLAPVTAPTKRADYVICRRSDIVVCPG
jgi:hypothetical protein